MRNIICTFFLLSLNFAWAQTVIFGKVPSAKEIVFYPPTFGNYNEEFPEYAYADTLGNYQISLTILSPALLKIGIGPWPLTVIIEPGDTLNIDNLDFSTYQNLQVKGKNSDGILYYNRVFDEPIMKKFNIIDEVFDKSNTSDTLLQSLEEAYSNSTLWIDSLYAEGLVSKDFEELLKNEIRGKLFFFTNDKLNYGNFTDQYKDYLLTSLFKLVDNDVITKTSGGFTAYSTFLDFKGDLHPEDLDENKQIYASPDFKGAQLARNAHQPYLYFRAITFLYTRGHDLQTCDAVKKYKTLFPEEQGYQQLLKKLNICNEFSKDTSGLVLKRPKETDFQSLVNSQLVGKRWYIDFWATWCGPCKVEFKRLTPGFDAILKKYGVEKLYISIDEKDELWERTVRNMNLKGLHFLINSSLANSTLEYLGMSNWVIPRYIIVSETGELINRNAPRPSDPNLNEVLEELFKQP